MKFEEIWERQLKFNHNFFDEKNSSSEEKQQHTKELILHLLSECDEVLREINWKMHRKHDIDQVNTENLVEEIVDVFKFVISLAQTWNVSAAEFMDQFDKKSTVVEQRFEKEKRERK